MTGEARKAAGKVGAKMYAWGKVRPGRMLNRLVARIERLQAWKRELENDFKLRMEIINEEIDDAEKRLRLVRAHVAQADKTEFIKRGRGRPKGPSAAAGKSTTSRSGLPQSSGEAPRGVRQRRSEIDTADGSKLAILELKGPIDLSTLPPQLAEAFPDHELSVAPESEMSDEDKLAWLKRVRTDDEIEEDLRIGRGVSGAFRRCDIFIEDRLQRERDRRSVWPFVKDRVDYVAEFHKDIRRGTKTAEEVAAFLHNYDTVTVPTMTRGTQHEIYMEIVRLLGYNIETGPGSASEENATQSTVDGSDLVGPDRPGA